MANIPPDPRETQPRWGRKVRERVPDIGRASSYLAREHHITMDAPESLLRFPAVPARAKAKQLAPAKQKPRPKPKSRAPKSPPQEYVIDITTPEYCGSVVCSPQHVIIRTSPKLTWCKGQPAKNILRWAAKRAGKRKYSARPDRPTSSRQTNVRQQSCKLARSPRAVTSSRPPE